MSSKEYERERYYWLKKHGICVSCCAENAVKGKVLCSRCAKTKSERKLIWLDKKFKSDGNYKSICRERSKKCNKKLRDQRRENGLCTFCGKPLTDNKYKRCAKCRAKSAEYARQYRAKHGRKTYEERVSGDYCYLCLAPLENPDKTKGAQVCDKCKEKLEDQLKKSRNTRSENDTFRKMNNAFWSEKSGGNNNDQL